MDHEDHELISEIGRAADAEKELRTRSGQIRARVLSLKGGRAFVLITLIVAAIASGWLAYHAEPGSYLENLWLELAAGFATFVAIPVLLRLSGAYQRAVLITGLGLAVGLGVLAGVASDVTRSLLLAGAIAIVLAIALEVIIADMLQTLATGEAKAAGELADIRARIDELRTQAEHARNTLDYKYAMHDFLGLPRPDDFGGIAVVTEQDPSD